MAETTEPSFAEFATMSAGNFLKAGDFKIGSKVQAKVVSYEGMNSFTDQTTNVSRSSPLYKVHVTGQNAKGEKLANTEATYRLNKTNAAILNEEYDVNDYPDLVGKTLTLQVGSTNKGNSFTVINVT